MNDKGYQKNIQDISKCLDTVRRSFPMPFSMFAGELLHELSTTKPNWSRVFSVQIDCFEGCVAFFFFVLLAEMEHQTGVELRHGLSDVRTFRDQKKLSTGHWWSLLRGVSKDIVDNQEHISLASQVALSLFCPKTMNLPSKFRNFAKSLNKVPTIRNQIKGHSYTPSMEQYAREATALLDITMEFFEVVRDIDKTVVFYVVQCASMMDGSFQMDVLLLDGDTRRPSRKSVTCSQAMAVDSIWICKTEDLDGSFQKAQCRLLSPYIEYNVDKNMLYICQQAHKDQFELLGVVGGERIVSNNSELGFRRLDSIVKRTSTVNLAFERLRKIAVEQAEKLLKSPAGRASYTPQTYLERPRLSQQLQAVGQQASDGVAIWLATAPSGSGKTAMACHVVSQWLDGGPQDVLTTVALSSDVMSAQGSIRAWWEQKFGETLTTSCKTVFNEKGHIRLFIDGLDRLSHPQQIVGDLVALFQDAQVRSVLRVIATSTELVSNQVSEALTNQGLGGLINRWSIPPLSPVEARALFIRIHPSAKEAELGDEVERLLTSPLLVRLAQVLGEHESTVGITPGRLLRAHADRTVLSDPVRSHLALDIVAKVLSQESKSIELGELLKDPSLRTVLLTTGKNSPLNQLIDNHVVLLDRTPAPNGLPLPSKSMLSFAFDAQLDYLTFAYLALEHGVDPEDWLKALRGRAPFGPLIGGLRIFVVESLLEQPSSATIEALANLLVGLGQIGEEVLKDLLTVGLDVSDNSPVCRLMSTISQMISIESLTSIADESIQRMVIAGRATASFALMEMLWRTCPCPGLVSLCRKVIHITVWAVGIEDARRLSKQLCEDSQTMSLDEQVVALDARREVCTLSGLQADRTELKSILEKLMSISIDDVESHGAKVVLSLTHARQCHRPLDGVDDVTVRGRLRDEHLAVALESANSIEHLQMMVIAEKALLYAEEGLHLTTREPRQQACAEAVEFACQVGDPFAEALGCDVAATVWHTDLAVRLDWIERGLVGAKALNAEVARARLLDKRGRIYLAQGRLNQAIVDAKEAAVIFERVGHQRHALRSKQHLYALNMHETGELGVAFEGWRELIPNADELGLTFQSRLLRTLYASVLCDLGLVTEAQQQIQTVAEGIANAPLAKDVHLGLVTGKLYATQQEFAKAIEEWNATKQWAKQIKFADVYFQASLQSTWMQLLMEYPTPEAEQKTRQRLIQEVRTQLEEKSFAEHQARYAGELRLVLSLALLLEGWMEEARSRLQDAQGWFADHSMHPKQAELRVVELLFEQQKLLESRGDKNFQQKFMGITQSRLKKCREELHRQSEGFQSSEHRQLFKTHHVIEKMIVKLVKT